TFYDGRHSGFWHSTARLSAQTPLLWALVGSALVALTMELRRRGKSALSRDGILPETVLFVVAIAALFVPGNSFASSLLILVPIAFLLAYRYASALWKQIPRHSAAYPAIATLLVFLCIVPFVLATRKGLGWQNTRQDKLMNLAEEITDPGKDCIYDPVGMVPTRPIVDPRAFLHGQSVDKLINGPGPKVRDMLAANPPAVIIPSYRTDWLPKADHEFIRKRYVAVADDFLVLGKVLPKGGGSFEIYHPGRYRISPLKGSSLMGTYFEPKNLAELVSQKPVAPPPPLAGTLDGKPLTAQPVELTVGFHQLKCAGDEVPAVVWVGPRLNQLPRIGSGNHDLLFYNWY
ncbi:MAG TPA: hypothetical protein VKA67_09735, partial [Verrucomicrobiae bacterium]|nr:hypothetical protein [Verrucomicrobiae bacterium]